LSLYRPAGLITHDWGNWHAALLDEVDIHVTDGPPECASAAILFGHLDRCVETAGKLGLPKNANPAAIYGNAHARYGPAADTWLSGNYCAIVIRAGEGLRVARSAWDAPPLYLYQMGNLRIISPLIRTIQSAGAPTTPAIERLRDALAFDFHELDDTTLYPGIVRLPLGCSAWLTGEGLRYEYRYDPGAIGEIRVTDGEAVETATHLLKEAVAEALANCKSPAIALSGGLDSSLVAAHAARQASPRQFHTITVRPDREWRESAGASPNDDEWAAVCGFAASYDNLLPHAVEAEEGDFDDSARGIFARSRLFSPGLANIGMLLPLWRKAVQLGCDSILFADLGNQGFSASGDWSYATDFSRLAWGRLAGNVLRQGGWGTRGRLLRQRVLSPLLPEWAKAAGRYMRSKPDDLRLASMLRPDALSRMRQERPVRSSAWQQGRQHMSRAELARLNHQVCDRGASDLLLALREIHGLRYRDVTAFRPLLEFCLSLPDDQYIRRGEDRFLARRMANGLMPEEQRLRKTMARHNVDWRERVGRRRSELAAYAARMGTHPLLAQLVDLERLERSLRDWPDHGGDHAEFMSGWFGVTSAVLAGCFLGAIEGRNDL